MNWKIKLLLTTLTLLTTALCFIHPAIGVVFGVVCVDDSGENPVLAERLLAEIKLRGRFFSSIAPLAVWFAWAIKSAVLGVFSECVLTIVISSTVASFTCVAA